LVRFTHFEATNASGEGLVSGQDALIRMGYRCQTNEPVSGVQFNIHFHDHLGNRLFICSTHYKNKNFPSVPSEGTVECRIPHLPLAAGSYPVDINIFVRHSRADYVAHAATVEVHEGDFYGSGQLPAIKHSGYMLVDHDWTLIE
jgi:lipopolysaccharide transport system ATP-binding protein